MSFGLTNVTAMFQDYIKKILAEKLHVLVIVYRDDIFIYTGSEEKAYIEAIWWIFDLLQKHLRYTNLKKCQFY